MATPDSDPLAPLTRDAAEHLDGLVTAARPAPDFAAMLARARELDPGAVSEDALAHAGALAPVIPLARGVDARSDAEALAPFTAALRAELDARLDERRMASIPPPPLPRGRRGLVVALAVVVAAAAAVVLALVLPDRLDRQGGDSGVAAARDGAVHFGGEARPGATSGEVVVPVPGDMSSSAAREPAGAAPGARDPAAEDMSSTAAQTPAAGLDDAAVAGGDKHVSKDIHRSGASRRRDSPAAPPPTAPGAPAGLSLEDEAQALWQKGELAAAERTYRRILAVAGATLRAELAYGDLFALARQLRGAPGQAAVWREYLDRFPSGRFADDARAGLCQREAVDARTACWRDYLDHHPTGAHRRQAEAALADGDAREVP